MSSAPHVFHISTKQLVAANLGAAMNARGVSLELLAKRLRLRPSFLRMCLRGEKSLTPGKVFDASIVLGICCTTFFEVPLPDEDDTIH